mmetsp:Transcript_7165/g.27009  ORF Transcript_7165/g.27009 Transcript_7165/m.27009 type:complete len:466 (+) Transcript_7165:220-1617(+)
MITFFKSASFLAFSAFAFSTAAFFSLSICHLGTGRFACSSAHPPQPGMSFWTSVLGSSLSTSFVFSVSKFATTSSPAKARARSCSFVSSKGSSSSFSSKASPPAVAYIATASSSSSPTATIPARPACLAACRAFAAPAPRGSSRGVSKGLAGRSGACVAPDAPAAAARAAARDAPRGSFGCAVSFSVNSVPISVSLSSSSSSSSSFVSITLAALVCLFVDTPPNARRVTGPASSSVREGSSKPRAVPPQSPAAFLLVSSSSETSASPRAASLSAFSISSRRAFASFSAASRFFRSAFAMKGNAKSPPCSSVSCSPCSRAFRVKVLAFASCLRLACVASSGAASSSSESEASVSLSLFASSSSPPPPPPPSPPIPIFRRSSCPNRNCSAMASFVPGRCARPLRIALFAHRDVFLCFRSIRSCARRYSLRCSAESPPSNPSSVSSSSPISSPSPPIIFTAPVFRLCR